MLPDRSTRQPQKAVKEFDDARRDYGARWKAARLGISSAGRFCRQRDSGRAHEAAAALPYPIQRPATSGALVAGPGAQLRSSRIGISAGISDFITCVGKALVNR